MAKLNLYEQLLAIRLADSGVPHADIASQLHTSPEDVSSIVASRSVTERVNVKATQRRNLDLNDKLRVVHHMQIHKNASTVGRIFQIHRKTVMRCWAKREAKVPGDVKRPLRAQYPTVEAEVVEFIRFARSQRLPVMSCHIKSCASKAAQRAEITGFKASNGWMQNFLRRTPVQPSFKLHGKRNSELPATAEEKMKQIRQTLANYDISNIYNMDESGLFYRMGPSRSYLDGNEDRRETRGTSMQKHKKRVTIVLCVNADGSHNFPVQYIGHSAKPTALKDPRFSALKSQYSSQTNAWMDSNMFTNWIQSWYAEVKKISNGPWCIVMDNCGGHESALSIPGVEIVTLPPRSTAKHQPLDLGLIANAKIRYRSVLLSETINVLQQRRISNSTFPLTSGNGKWGLREGQLPHIGDAIELFNQSWSGVSKTIIIKCWLKSECLGEDHTSNLKQKIELLNSDGDVDIDLTVGRSVTSASIENPVDPDMLRNINDALMENQYLENGPQTPLNEILAEVSNLEAQANLINILNSPAPSDTDTRHKDISEDSMLKLYEDSRSISDSINLTATNEIDQGETHDKADVEVVKDKWECINSATANIKEFTTDPKILELLEAVEARAQTLSQSE